MKFRVTMKDPDGVFDCLREAVEGEVAKMEGLDASERDGIIEERIEKQQEKMKRWFEYNEYLTVEVNTDAGTCVVVEKQ